MKKYYNTPEADVVYVNSADCITVSRVGIGHNDNDNTVNVSDEAGWV